MNVYHFYLNKKNDIELIQANDSFSFTGFLLGIVWVLYKRLWSIASIILFLNVIISFLNMYGFVSPNIIIIFNLLVSLIVGFYGNRFYIKKLNSRGYFLYDVICQESKDKARYKFLKRHSNLFWKDHNVTI